MARFGPFSSVLNTLVAGSSPDYGPCRGPGLLRPIGDLSPPPVNACPSLQDRRSHLRDLGNAQNQLIDDLLHKLDTAQKQIKHLEDLASVGATANSRAELLEEQLKQIETIVDRDPCVRVLFDGNHITFTGPLLTNGEAGGKDAAARLYRALQDGAATGLPDVKTPNLKLTMYADFKGLVAKLVKSKVIEEATTFTDFVRGFNSTAHLFDLIDAGTNHGYSEKKLQDQMRLDLRNCHVRHVLAGGFVGDAYSELRLNISEVPFFKTRVTLLDINSNNDVQSGKKRPFSTLKIDDVLCDVSSFSTASSLAPEKSPAITAAVALPLARAESSSTASLATPPASGANSPQMTWAGLAACPGKASASPEPVNSTSSTILSKSPSKPAVNTSRQCVIEYNRSGQRIDKKDTMIPHQDITRIKKMKLCNIFYLQDAERCITGCGHRHDYAISNFERRVLREVARMTPCYYGLNCDDPNCIYGHRCPQNKPNENSCYYGRDCRFWGWGHGIDTTVVKLTKV